MDHEIRRSNYQVRGLQVVLVESRWLVLLGEVIRPGFTDTLFIIILYGVVYLLIQMNL